MQRFVIVMALVATATTASARPEAWQTGGALRTDYGAHRVRLTASLRLHRVAFTAIIDPKVYVDTQQNDTDMLAEWQVFPHVASLFAGWRLSQIKVDRGVAYEHQTLLGAFGELPSLIDNRVRARFGIELEATAIRHGAGTETEFLSFTSERHWRDLIGINLCLRFEFVTLL